MADITIAPITPIDNSVDISTDGIIDLGILITSVDNSNTLSTDSKLSFILTPNNISNSNTLEADNSIATNVFIDSIINVNQFETTHSISFGFSANSIDNISILVPIDIDSLAIHITADSINDSVDTITDHTVGINFLKLISPIINTNIVGGITSVGKNISYETDSIVNSNTVSQPLISIENITITATFNKRTTPNRTEHKDFTFSDLSLDFLAHPITGDISVLYDYNAIQQSMLNIIKTKRYERPFESYDIASRISSLLFELSGGMMLTVLKSELFNALVNNEPRILLYDILLKEIPERHLISVQIFYKIRTFERIEEFKTTISRT